MAKLGCHSTLRVVNGNCGNHYHGKLGCSGWSSTCSAEGSSGNGTAPRRTPTISHAYSAACYFAAARWKNLGTPEALRPVGLVWDSLGGTPIEHWMNAEALAACGSVNASDGAGWWTIAALCVTKKQKGRAMKG